MYFFNLKCLIYFVCFLVFIDTDSNYFFAYNAMVLMLLIVEIIFGMMIFRVMISGVM